MDYEGSTTGEWVAYPNRKECCYKHLDRMFRCGHNIHCDIVGIQIETAMNIKQNEIIK